VKVAGFSGPNIISVNRPIIFVATIADFVVDSDSVSVNGVVVLRSGNTATIVIAANFS